MKKGRARSAGFADLARQQRMERRAFRDAKRSARREQRRAERMQRVTGHVTNENPMPPGQSAATS